MSERSEAFLRIIVGIVSGIILGLWKSIVQLVTTFQWIYVVISGKRSQGLAEFCNLWNTQVYRYIRYMTFTTNERPFPFTALGNVKDEVVLTEAEKKKKK